eukprot:5248340-Pyramimonas_sp.AAC.1
MMPNDLVVKSGGSVARLKQGPLRGGRITRHRTDLEATRGDDGIGQVHLRAASPCALPEADRPMVRVSSSRV